MKKNISESFKKAFYILTSVLAALSVFIIFTSFSLRLTLLNAEFHKRVLERNGVYLYVQDLVKSSMPELSKSVITDKQKGLNKQENTLSVLEESVTEALIKDNINSVVDGVFKYFEGKTNLLPYIHLANKPESPSAETPLQGNGFSLPKVDKINLGALLMYLNRADITEVIFSIKYFFYLVDAIPQIFLPVLFLLFTIFMGVYKKILRGLKWASKVILTGGIILAASSFALLTFTLLAMPSALYPFAMSLPLQNELVISYMRSSFISLSLLMLLFGIISVFLPALICAIIIFISKKAKLNIIHMRNIPDLQRTISNFSKKLKPIVPVVYAILLLSSATLTTVKFQAFKKNSVPNGLNSLIARFNSMDSSTRVVAAKDEMVYVLEVRLIENETGSGAEGFNVSVNGKSSCQEKYFNETGITDINGLVRFTLDKGTYQVSFSSRNTPSQYILPAPFFVNLKTAGTTITTINIDNSNKVNKGIAQIEVLNEKGHPMPNLRIYTNNQDMSKEFPEKIYAYTNSEGIAMFRLLNGTYKAYFDNSLFPQEYIIPFEMEITVGSDLLNRYTISLVKKKS